MLHLVGEDDCLSGFHALEILVPMVRPDTAAASLKEEKVAAPLMPVWLFLVLLFSPGQPISAIKRHHADGVKYLELKREAQALKTARSSIFRAYQSRTSECLKHEDEYEYLR